MTNTSSPPPGQAAGRRTFLLIAAALASPFVLAAGMYFSGWYPWAGKPRGELLPAAPALAISTLDMVAGPPLDSAEPRWLLVIAGPCTTQCAAQLDMVRRVHTALYKGMPRVRRVLLADTVPSGAQPDLIIARPTGAWATLTTQTLSVTVVDPAGNAMLRYQLEAADFKPADMLKDVDRLLRYSWVG